MDRERNGLAGYVPDKYVLLTDNEDTYHRWLLDAETGEYTERYTEGSPSCDAVGELGVLASCEWVPYGQVAPGTSRGHLELDA